VVSAHDPTGNTPVESIRSKESYMGVFDKVKDKAEQLVGEAKEKIGHIIGNEDLETAGKRDQLSGEVKEAGHDLRDKAAGAVEDAKDRLKDDNT
jgi:uncharacterized protein YjbJ (UPF0337 family)